ncbi:MAG: 3D domain-containing protein [Clostridiales bacterium]|nr:3D domain-containing protein [Clostridiales bacterium]MDD7035013.1 3D domain-containing protein [Bacillota bacterium]MDY2921159.1 3D domain-containing protein [Lentihominibacter sp.]
MERIREYIRKHKSFCIVLAVAVGINLVAVGVLVYLEKTFKNITISVDGKTLEHKTTADTVDDLLKSWGVTLDEEDEVKPGDKARLKDGTEVDIRLFHLETEVVSEETDYKTKTRYTSDILEGEERVAQKGVKGEDKVTYTVAYLGDEEQKRRETDRETVKKPVTEIIEKGTAVSYNGEKYSRKLTVVSTGYTHTGNRTATGTRPKRGTMAVDRRVIPMGSYGYVPGYGKVHAEDTGGAIKGNRIDLFFETRGQAVSWGRRTVDIYIK